MEYLNVTIEFGKFDALDWTEQEYMYIYSTADSMENGTNFLY